MNAGPTLCDMSEVLRKNWADGVVLARPLAAEPCKWFFLLRREKERRCEKSAKSLCVEGNGSEVAH